MTVTHPSRPGVYVSEAPLSQVVPLAATLGTYGTFLGTALKGPTSPTLVNTWSDYVNNYGDFSSTVSLPMALYQYFSNGGGPAFVCRVIDGTGSVVANSIFDDGVTAEITSVSAGTPGAFVPGNATPPANITLLRSHPAVGDTPYGSTAAWAVGNYVLLGDGSKAAWNGNTWVVGQIAAITGVVAGSPGYFVPSTSPLPATLAALKASTVVGDTGSAKPTLKWTVGQHVVLSDNSHAHWSTNTGPWAAGDAPAVLVKGGGGGGKSRDQSPPREGEEPEVAPRLSRQRIEVTAVSPGKWGNDILYSILPYQKDSGILDIDGNPIVDELFSLMVYEFRRGVLVTVERFSDLTMDPVSSHYFVDVINSFAIGSRYIRVQDLKGDGMPLATSTGAEPVALTGGKDGNNANIGGNDYLTAFQQFVEVDALLVVNVPGDPDVRQLELEIQKRGDSVLIVDPAEDDDPLIDSSYLPVTSYGASYYPWIYVSDPSPDTPRGSIMKVPPGASVAGAIIRTDVSRGVFKAPAGVGTNLFGAVRTAARLSNEDQDALASKNVNVVRSLAGVGVAILGARTRSNDIAQYLPVRRTLNFIKRRAVQVSRFALFEPNAPRLWEQLRVANGAYLSELWIAGGLAGNTMDQAFYVKCDEDNNTPQSMSNGELHIEIGVAPVFPAEFVIIRVGQYEAGSAVIVQEG